MGKRVGRRLVKGLRRGWDEREVVATARRIDLGIGDHRMQQGANSARLFMELLGQFSGSQRAIGLMEGVEDSLTFRGDRSVFSRTRQRPLAPGGIEGERDMLFGEGKIGSAQNGLLVAELRGLLVEQQEGGGVVEEFGEAREGIEQVGLSSATNVMEQDQSQVVVPGELVKAFEEGDGINVGEAAMTEGVKGVQHDHTTFGMGGDPGRDGSKHVLDNLSRSERREGLIGRKRVAEGDPVQMGEAWVLLGEGTQMKSKLGDSVGE
jgi:hypothetical protein